MSYNIDTVKIKEMDNLRVPKSHLKEIVDGSDGFMNLNADLDGNWKLYAGEYESKGHMDGDDAVFDKFGIGGEGSGTCWGEYMKPLLEGSSGFLKARFVWEGGDSIELVTVKDGVVTEEED